ncbi:hypothetical protein B0H11DRAFT_2048587 [Mycena galericulata]|nr:hypothetical protein B0H11DRAFT_2048587 [Mycena galericulata]
MVDKYACWWGKFRQRPSCPKMEGECSHRERVMIRENEYRFGAVNSGGYYFVSMDINEACHDKSIESSLPLTRASSLPERNRFFPVSKSAAIASSNILRYGGERQYGTAPNASRRTAARASAAMRASIMAFKRKSNDGGAILINILIDATMHKVGE